jgi:alpha-L-rhamnosidase
MLGQINKWFFHDLAGIQPDPDSPGFKEIVIRPAVVGDLTLVKASYNSVRGKIESEWQRSGRAFSLNVSIPANTTAIVWLPAASASSVLESGHPASSAEGVQLWKTDDRMTAYKIGSGEYHFTSQL